MAEPRNSTRAEGALLALLGYEERSGGVWLHPDGNRLAGGREEALDEACADVELREAKPREDFIDPTLTVKRIAELEDTLARVLPYVHAEPHSEHSELHDAAKAILDRTRGR